MERSIIFKVVITLGVIGAIVLSIGGLAYNMGVSRGMMTGAQWMAWQSAGAEGALLPSQSYGMPGMLPFTQPHFGFGGPSPFGCLFGLLLLFLFFGVLRVFGGRHRWAHMHGKHGMHGPCKHGHGPWGGSSQEGQEDEDEVPEFIREWHSRMHDKRTADDRPQTEE